MVDTLKKNYVREYFFFNVRSGLKAEDSSWMSRLASYFPFVFQQRIRRGGLNFFFLKCSLWTPTILQLICTCKESLGKDRTDSNHAEKKQQQQQNNKKPVERFRQSEFGKENKRNMYYAIKRGVRGLRAKTVSSLLDRKINVHEKNSRKSFFPILGSGF